MMEGVKSRADHNPVKGAKPPGYLAMFDCNNKLHDVIDRQPSLNGLSEEYERHECERVGNEIVDWVCAHGGNERQSLLRMMYAVKRPQKSAGMLPPVNPISSEVCKQEIDKPSYECGDSLE